MLPGFDDVPAVQGPKPGALPPSPKTPNGNIQYGRRADERIALGIHPLQYPTATMATALRLKGNGETCGSCMFRAESGARRAYWKCLLGPKGRSEATDVRLRWPACTRWQRRGTEASL